ncbi:coiled-coil domain-containing protein 90B, mitochondrial isoform X1 [Monodelphis domestica]|uniref:Coiled-coil domain containing 90B n=1 Tax=Monodelphis domestica TaxID=13616 RepID=F6R6U9_MONDO|nr:coiled-coil domain-containing protein 90B, mitochondrial isoform X1 [Monodelphis domestica]XP_056650886.1 coiled-coil domain-containing protein 90B, mitochondrial isoform X1 [Monodelphis domestica]
MRGGWVCQLLHLRVKGVHSGTFTLHGRPIGGTDSSLIQWRGFLTTSSKKGYDMRSIDITPLEQRKLTFDSHALVQDLEKEGFEKAKAETIVSALTVLSNVSLDTIYKEMVTRTQQEITVQQLMSHLDSIRKDMVILEKSEFANLRAENAKMKVELEQVKQLLLHESGRIRANNKLDINLERSRVTDLFNEIEKKVLEATTEFNKKDTYVKGIIAGTSNKIDIEIASLKTLMESNKLDTIRYLAATVFSCLAMSLGFYSLWK